MFVGVEKNKSNERTIIYLENLIINKELKRIILFSSDMDKSHRLVQDFLTALNANRFKTAIFTYEDVINQSYEVYQSKYDLIVIDGFLNNLDLTDEENTALQQFLDFHQHKYIFLHCPLTPERVFSLKGEFLDEPSFSRSIFGCKQLFWDDSDREEFLKHLYHYREISLDHRIRQSIDFLENEIDPYYELKFLTKEKIKSLLLNGDDNINSVIIITKEPELKLVPFESLKSFDVAVRLESFAAGNGYVGKDPSNSRIDEYFRTLLEGFYTFLKTGEEQYLDYVVYSPVTDLDLILKIKKEMNKIEI
ncbi:hypothetical protein QMZ64_21805 [Bacillus sp. LB7]|uniref:hypothetical protein n=1 Tax=Bacillus sp. LB7 TaxID=3043238 RepID=UPI00264708F6|nr:hypothetical protein [Bacillus sp. LB7]MDN5390025.1 hypothetical protein [Bacillus sp. LB7]